MGLGERPQCIEDAVCGVKVCLVGLHNHLARMAVERRWHASRGEGHGEAFEKCDAENLEIVGKTFGSENTAGRDIEEHTGMQFTVNKVHVRHPRPPQDDAHPVVVDDERCLLQCEVAEDSGISPKHTHVAADNDVLSRSFVVRIHDFLNGFAVQKGRT